MPQYERSINTRQILAATPPIFVVATVCWAGKDYIQKHRYWRFQAQIPNKPIFLPSQEIRASADFSGCLPVFRVFDLVLLAA